jgi:hypothetical protein
MGKNVIYDIHDHKITLYNQIFDMFIYFLVNIIGIPVETITQVKDKFTKDCNILAYNLKSIRDFNNTPSNISERAYNTITNITKKNTSDGPTLVLSFMFQKKSMIITNSYLKGETHRFSIEVFYGLLDRLNDSMYTLSEMVLLHKERFIEWLRAEQNMEMKMMKLVADKFN